MSTSGMSDEELSPVHRVYSMENLKGSPLTLPPMSSLLRHDPVEEALDPFQNNLSLSCFDLELSTSHTCQPQSQFDSFGHVEGPHIPVGMENLTSPFSYPKLIQRRQSRKILQRRFEHQKYYREVALRKGGNYSRKVEAEFHPNNPQSYTSLNLFSSKAIQPRKSQSMAISNLLTDTVGPFPRLDPTIRIQMRQQPIAARACGFGERDRRVIDPPPILQIMVSNTHTSSEDLKVLLYQNYAVVHCVLWDPINDCDNNTMPCNSERRHQRRLMGTVVASPFFGDDEYGVEGCFFTFPDLSVRTPGTYSLKFSLIILSLDKMAHGASAPVQSSVWSCPFEVFNAKDFCGMRPSTELTKRLKSQGCMISVKKGSLKTSTRGHGDKEIDKEHDSIVPRLQLRGEDVKRVGRKRSLHLYSTPYDARPSER
ncbi:hypothetical protein K3495_g6029 [Podosphaera aphanis]|nr:hypothetical protein K3495_g6029 [Podosphaera aphanis]